MTAMTATSVTPSNYDLTNQYTLVADDERMNFLPQHFRNQFLAFELNLFNAATKTIEGYKGGYWEFAYTHDGTPFVFLKTPGPLTISTLFGTNETQMPTEIAGIICTALACLTLVERAHANNLSEDQAEGLIDLYYNLQSAGQSMAEHCGLESEYFRLID